jgi:xanthine dehydrogenase accessory factor
VQQQRWQLAVAGTNAMSWQVDIAPPPSVLVLGAGPETPTLLPLLRTLGWTTTLVERRSRWKSMVALADVAVEQAPDAALSHLPVSAFDAVLVMHHNFELDREALSALAAREIGFIGLLGPTRRREDLFRVLPPDARAALLPRLRSPVGLDLGGHGPEAIALSIAAQLHAFRHPP